MQSLPLNSENYEGGEEDTDSLCSFSDDSENEEFLGGEREEPEMDVPDVDDNHIFMVQVNSNFNLPIFDINYSKEKKMISNIG